MNTEGYQPYEPLDKLKPIAESVWIVDAPEIKYRVGGLSIPCPTRMTVVRLADSSIWLHSPTKFTAALAKQIEELGVVRFIVAPNTLHYTFVHEWKTAFPEAVVYAVPELALRTKGKFPEHKLLSEAAPEIWSSAIRQIMVSSRMFSEVCFFHIPTKTLILADLIGNFEADRVRSSTVRFLLRQSKCVHPHGSTSMDVRLGLLMKRKHVGAAVQQMIAWGPERIILAHGLCYASDAVNELKRSFKWAL
jgi:Domain of unknown function (DUF4336)